MNTKLATTQIRITEWAAIIKDCKSSGMKVDDYCQLHDISRDAYYYWLRKVKTAALQQAGFVELPMPKAKPVPAYSARTAHPFRRNGAPFRFKLSKAQQIY